VPRPRHAPGASTYTDTPYTRVGGVRTHTLDAELFS
jgi:hypothetical protein